MAGRIIIETERLIIREMTAADTEALYRIYDDEDAARFLDPLSEDMYEEREKLQAYIDFVYNFYGFGFWAICDKETGRFIGRCGLNVTQIEDDVFVEIGYLIDKSLRRQGLAAEAVKAVLDYAGEELEIPEIAACIAPDNRASLCMAEKLGFIYQKDFQRLGQNMCLYLMALDNGQQG